MRLSIRSFLRHDGGAFLALFLLSFAVRAYFLARTDLDLLLDPVSELGCLARSIALHGTFADPYCFPTGPTAHLPPAYVSLVALIWKEFGLTATAGLVRGVLCVAAYSAGFAMLPWLARRLGLGWRAGVLGGIAGALLPIAPMEGGFAWEEPYAMIALALVLIAYLNQWTADRTPARAAFGFGIAQGAALHLAPNLFPVMLGCAAFGLVRRRNARQGALTAMMALGMALACVPWAARNVRELGGAVPVRSNFGLELRLANHDGASPAFDVTLEREGDAFLHPLGNAGEAARVRELGELEYMRRARNEALAWMRDHPGEFARLTALRVVHFWCGPLHDPRVAAGYTLLTLLAVVGAARALPRLTVPQRAAVLIPLAAYPLVYYLVSYMDRYRTPVHWILLVLAGAAVMSRAERPGGGGRRGLRSARSPVTS